MTNEHAGHNPVFHEHDGNETIWLMGLVSWKTQFLLFMIMDRMRFLGDGFLGVFLIYIWNHRQHKQFFILITLIFC